MAGKGIQSLLQEAGGHRIQRIPPTEKRGRVHTSSVTVAVFEPSRSSKPLEFDEREFHIEWFSGTGKGGQHRNKCQNSCRVIHIKTGLIETRQGRSRKSNKREAIEALTLRLEQSRNKALLDKIDSIRSNQIGKGLRGDKIRTYREKDNRVTNHLNGKTARYYQVMKGNFVALWD